MQFSESTQLYRLQYGHLQHMIITLGTCNDADCNNERLQQMVLDPPWDVRTTNSGDMNRNGCREVYRRPHVHATGQRCKRVGRPSLASMTWADPFAGHSCKRTRLSWTSFLTPTDRTLAASMVWVALVALLAVNPAAFWCNMLGFTSNVALHGLQNGRLHPSGTVPVGLFLRQEVEIFGRLVGQAHGDDGFTLPHTPSDTMVHNKYFQGTLMGGGLS